VEDSSKADKVQKSETKPVGSTNAVTTLDEATGKCWAVNLSSGASDHEDLIGCARRAKQPPLHYTRFR
jgi:hypothetical protein